MDILNGTSRTQSFAPLSQSQTVSVCKHLQEQIDALWGQISNLDLNLNYTSESLQGFRDSINSSPFEHTVKDALLNATTSIEAIRKEHLRTSQAVGKLQTGLELSNENIMALREGQKITNVNLQKIVQDLAQTTATTNSLREVLEKQVFGDIEKLRDGLGRTDLLIQHLQQEGELKQASVQNQKEELRGVHLACQNTRDEVVKTNAHINIVEQRFVELSKMYRETKQCLDETSAARARLHDDHETTRCIVQELQTNVKRAGAVAKQAADGVEVTKQELATAKAQRQSNATTGESNLDNISQMQMATRSLKEGQERMGSQLANLFAAFEQTRSIALETKRGLKQTNSLVLPNLQMDTMRSPSMQSTIAPSLDLNSSRGLMSSGGSARLPGKKSSSLMDSF